MEELAPYYIELLHLGMLNLRQAIYAKDNEWAELEVQALHNLPYLICETNIRRHHDYWFVERELYLERLPKLKHDTTTLDPDEAEERVLTYAYIWDEMEPILLRLFEQLEKPESPEN